MPMSAAQKRLDNREKRSGLLGMQPMAGIVDAGDFGSREQASDRGLVLGTQVVGLPASDEQSRPIVDSCWRQLGKIDEPRHCLLNRRKIEAPARPAVLEYQVLQQKGALGGVGYRGGEAGIGLGPAVEAGEVESAHRLNMSQMMRRVLDRGDV